MEQSLSPLNQGFNPLRGTAQWGQMVAMPGTVPVPGGLLAQPTASAAPVAPPGTAPLWLALQPYANARLCLFEVDRPGSKEPVPIRRDVIDCFLEPRGIVSGYN